LANPKEDRFMLGTRGSRRRQRPYRLARRRFQPFVEILEKRELLDSTPNQYYIAQVYQDLLLRNSDAAGLAYWSGQLDNGAPRGSIANSLDHSAEYFQTNIIKPAYQQFLGRQSDQAGLDFWTSQLQGGLTDEQMQAGFIASTEFYDNANGSATPVPITPAHDRAWVDALYQALLKRPPDQTGEDYWTNQLQGQETRLQVANGFTGSTEGLGLRVMQTYQRYLHRSAGQSEIDYWVSQYHAGFTNEGIVTGFLSSNEYYANAQFSLSITGPSNGLATRTNVTVMGQYIDPSSTITNFQAQVDSAAPSSATFDTTGHFNFTTQLALDGSADGSHTVHFTATDQAGKIATKAIAFTLDTRPPVVTSNSPAPGVAANGNITIMGTVSDSGSGVAGLQARLDNGSAGSVTIGAAGAFSFTTALALDGSADGAHTVHFTAADTAGNTGGLDFPFTLHTGTTGPALNLASPVSGGTYLGTAHVTGTASAQSTSARFALDGGAFVSLTLGTGGSFDQALATPLVAGPHQLVVQAVDSGGHQTQQTVNFTVGTAISLPEAGGLLSQTTAPVQLGTTTGTRTLSFNIAPQFDSTDTTSLGGDRFLVSLVSAANPSQVLLDGGQPGTPLFALAKNGTAEYLPGRVRYDGSLVQIDASSVTTANGLLLFQLLGNDTDTTSVVAVSNIADAVDASISPGPVFPATPDNVVAAGSALNIGSLTAASGVTVLLSKVNVNVATGAYTAELRVRDDGSNLGKTIAVVFPGLPAGVQLQQASGTDANGSPYVTLTTAIPSGGLTTGTTSAAVQLTFSDPGLARFVLAPQVLAGAANQAPTLSPIGPLTVAPGGHLSVQLQASDPDGDPVQFSVRGTMPTGNLQTDGTLTFDPTPADVGTYNFTAVASDGVLESTQPVTLTVAGTASATTSIAGVVQDTSGHPVAGVPLTLGSAMATTAADGRFTLSFTGAVPATLLAVNGGQAPGSVVYPSLSVPLSQVLTHAVYTGFSNAIDRPIYLTPLDVAEAAAVSAAQDTTITTSTLPGAKLLIKAGSVHDLQGNVYTGRISITNIPIDHTPTSLGDLTPSVGVLIESLDKSADQLTFTAPVTLTLPNVAKNTANSQSWLAQRDPVTGLLANTVLGAVSGDGTSFVVSFTPSFGHAVGQDVYDPQKVYGHSIAMKPKKCDCDDEEDGGSDSGPLATGGESPASDAPQASLPPLPHAQYPSKERQNPTPLNPLVPVNSQEVSAEGALQRQQLVSSYSSNGVSRQIVLNYDSLWADPTDVVHVQGADPNAGQFGDSNPILSVNVGIQSGGFTTEMAGGSAGTNYFRLGTDGSTAGVGVMADFSSMPTGEYGLSVRMGTEQFSGTTLSGSFSTQESGALVVNTSKSSFGSGWSLAGSQEVVPNSDGSALVVQGDGTRLLFDAPTTPGSPYVAPDDEFSTLVRHADGTFTRTMTDQTVYTFNAANQLGSIRDSTGNMTQFTYDGSGNLTMLTDPVGQQTMFSYSSGMVSSITTPDGKTTQLMHDAARNLMALMMPDGSMHHYGYDAHHLLNSSTDANGNITVPAYDFAGRVQSITHPDGSMTQFASADVQDVFPPGQTLSPVSAPLARAARPFVERVADAKGNVTATTLNDMFQYVSSVDGLGAGTSVQYNAQSLVSKTIDSLGHVQLFTYDANGNQLSSRDELSNAASVTGAIGQPGEQHSYTFSGTTGQRLFFNSLGDTSGSVGQLTAPSGAIVESFATAIGSDSGPVTLIETGTYTLTVTGAKAGSYSFQVIDGSTTDVLPLDTPVSGIVDRKFGADIYRVDGTAGQRFYFHTLSDSGAIQVIAYGPDNSIPAQGGSTANSDRDITLPATGTYLLVVEPTATATTAVDYSFELSDPATTTAALSLDTATTFTVQKPGDRIRYTFTGQVGQRVYLDDLSSIGPTGSQAWNSQFLGPDGTALFTGQGDQGPVTLTEAGTYTLVATGSQPGSYPFMLRDVASAPALTQGMSVTANLDPATETNLYTIACTVGQVLQVHMNFLGAENADPTVPLPTVFWSVDNTEGQVLQSGFATSNLQATLLASGTYVLAIRETTAGSPVTYSFQVSLVTQPPVASSGFNTVQNGTLAAGGQASFPISGSAGLPVYLDDQSTPGSFIHYELHDSTGLTVNTGSPPPIGQGQDQGPFILPTSGNYSLVVKNNGGSSAAYQFRLLDLTSATPLTLAQTVSATLASGYQTDVYSIATTPEQLLYYDALGSNSGQATVTVASISSQSLLQAPSTDATDDHLFAAGPGGVRYLIVANQQATGTAYSFRVLDPATATQLSANMAVNGMLADPAQADLYRLSGSAGQYIYVDASSASFVSATLYSPSGTQVTGTGNAYTLPGDGTFVLAVTSSPQVAMGSVSYTLQVRTPPINSTTLTAGVITSGMLGTPDEIDRFTFTANLGQQIFPTGLNSQAGTSSIELTDPEGSALFASPVTVSAAGTYTVTVTGTKPDSYQFRLLDDAVAPAITAGPSVTGTLNWQNDEILYRYTGTPGQRVLIQTASSLTWTFYASTGAFLASNAEATVPSDGTVLVLVGPSPGATFPDSFSFQLLTPQTATTALTLGTTTSGTLTGVGDRQVFTFHGTAGQRVYYNDLGSTAFIPGDELQGPNGQSVFVDPFGGLPQALPATGAYTLTFQAQNAGDSYNFRLLDLSSAATLTLSATTSGMLNVQQIGLYQVAGTARQRLTFHSVTDSSGGAASWTLYGPDDAALNAGTALNTDFDAVLPAAGTYTLLVNPGNTNTPVSYSFQVTDTTPAPVTPSGFGTVHSGMVAAGAQATYMFNAPAGLPVYLDNQGSSDNSVAYQLLDPSSNAVLSASGSDDGQNGVVILQNSGAYTLQISGPSSGTANYSFRLLDLSANALPLTLGTAVSATLNPGLQTDMYAFSGAAGQRLVYQPIQTTNVTVLLRNLGGGFTTVSSSAPIITLPETATYYIEVTGNQSSSTSYSFLLSDVAALQAVTSGVTLSGGSDPATQHAYRIDGTAGQRIFLSASGLTVYTPAGQQLPFSNIMSLGSGSLITLPSAGPYVLLPTAGVSYNAQVTFPASTTGTLTLATGLTGRNRVAVDPVFNQPTSEIDSLGRQTHYQVNPATGNILSMRQLLGPTPGPNDVVTQFSYTATGQVQTKTDALGRITQYSYDTQGHTTQVTYAKGTPDQAVVQYAYDASGNITTYTDANGHATHYQYDVMNRLTQVTDPLGNVTKYAYDTAGNVMTVTDARNNVTTYAYDRANRLISTTAADGAVTKDTHDGNGNLLSITDPLGRVTTYAYNARDQQIAVADPLSNLTTTSYDSAGNVLAVTDPAGRATGYSYDAAGQKISATDPNGAITRSSYDAAGERISVTDPDGNTTTYTYDTLGRVTKETEALGVSRTYQYNAIGVLSSEADAAGRTRQFTYNNLDKRTSETWLDAGGQPIQTIVYSYDISGQLTGATDSTSTYQLTYDANNRVTSVSNAGTPGTPTVVMTDSYDADGNVVSRANTINGNLAGTTAYSYDFMNRMTRITETGPGVGDKRIDLGYNPDGELTSVARYADLAGTNQVAMSQYGYDASSRLTQLTHVHGATTIAAYTWAYDGAGRITAATSPDGSDVYNYDASNQLTSASHTSQANEAYTYDANGNRTNTGYQTGPDNRLLSDGTFNYVYDAEGNRIRRTEITSGNETDYQWDYRNRLTGVVFKNNAGHTLKTIAYVYDVFDNRIGETVTDATTGASTVQRFIWDTQQNEVALQFDANGNLTHDYLHGPAVDQVFADDNGQGTVLWPLTDNRGSVRDIVNSAGILQDHLIYDSFGRLSSETNTAVNHLFMYTGSQFDSATGLYYDRARYYDASVGRFLSEDPIGFAGGQANLSEYAGDDPISETDPFGTSAFTAYAIYLPIGGIGAHESIVIVDNTSGAGYYFSGNGQNPEQASLIPKSADDIQGLLHGDVRKLPTDSTLTFADAIRRLRKLKNKVDKCKRPYAIIPGSGYVGNYLGDPGALKPNAVTSDTVSADAKRLLGAPAGPLALGGIPYFLPGTGQTFLPPPAAPFPQAPPQFRPPPF
jgi:RHS repeat-associated protein